MKRCHAPDPLIGILLTSYRSNAGDVPLFFGEPDPDHMRVPDWERDRYLPSPSLIFQPSLTGPMCAHCSNPPGLPGYPGGDPFSPFGPGGDPYGRPPRGGGGRGPFGGGPNPFDPHPRGPRYASPPPPPPLPCSPLTAYALVRGVHAGDPASSDASTCVVYKTSLLHPPSPSPSPIPSHTRMSPSTMREGPSLCGGGWRKEREKKEKKRTKHVPM